MGVFISRLGFEHDQNDRVCLLSLSTEQHQKVARRVLHLPLPVAAARIVQTGPPADSRTYHVTSSLTRSNCRFYSFARHQ